MKNFWIPFIFFALSFYSLGAGIMDSFAIYHSWLYVGEDEFAALHQATGKRIVLLLVIPMLILTVFCVLMFWFRPAPVSKSLVWFALAGLIMGWISSAFIQIPIQVQLSMGKDDALLHKLIVSDWIRFFAWIIYITAVINMALRIQQAYVYKYQTGMYHNKAGIVA